MKELMKRFWQDETGLELSEYAVMTFLIIIAVVVTMGLLGTRINAIFVDLIAKLS